MNKLYLLTPIITPWVVLAQMKAISWATGADWSGNDLAFLSFLFGEVMAIAIIGTIILNK